MSSNRFLHRKYKLQDRGWKELSDKSDFEKLKIRFNILINLNIGKNQIKINILKRI